MKIKILLCDTFPGLLPDFITSYVSMFTRLFDAVDENIEYEVYRTMDGELPELLSFDGFCLITGCNLSAYDEIEWIEKLRRWIVCAATADVRLVGICFGHQVIAQALGGSVERAPQGWGTGVRESTVDDDDALRFFPDGKMRLLYNHHDQVVRLPRGARLVAHSDFCPIESFRIGEIVLTFQGHPEYVPEYSKHLLDNFAADEPLEVRRKALDSLEQKKHQGLDAARFILSFARSRT